MIKSRLSLITAFIVMLGMLFLVTFVRAELSVEAGGRSGYSSGLTESNYQLKAFIDMILSNSMVEVKAGGCSLQHFQITDGSDVYEYADIYQGGGEINLFPNDAVDLSAGYRYSAGNFTYRGHQVLLEAVAYMGDFSATGNIDFRTENYTLNATEYDNSYLTWFTEAGYNISDDWSIDAGYSTYSLDFSGSTDAYVKRMIRIGFTGIMERKVTVIGGVSTGSDSADYRLYGADGGITLKLYNHLGITLAGGYTYYRSMTSDSTIYGTTSGYGSGSGSSAGSGTGLTFADRPSGSNPFLSSSRTGTSFGTWNVSVGITVKI